jgi:hypothetical protein
MTIAPGEPQIKPEDFLSESRNISNSEVTTFLSCKRMYDFAFIEQGGLEPKETPRHLSRGSIGHGAFEAYIKARLNSGNHEQSMKAAIEYLITVMSTGEGTVDVVGEVRYLFQRYMDYHHGWPKWKLLGTEDRVDLQLTDTLKIAIRYDLLVVDLESGKTLLGDWKFTYDFWSPNDHNIHPQIPKYIAVMQANNHRVDGGFIYEVRTRSLGKEKASNPKNLWRQTFYYPTQAHKMNVMRQHISASQEIEKHRALDPEFRKNYVSLPILNKYGTCRYCPFIQLCDSMNKGKTDLRVDIEHSFKRNSYGYNAEPTNETGF